MLSIAMSIILAKVIARGKAGMSENGYFFLVYTQKQLGQHWNHTIYMESLLCYFQLYKCGKAVATL